MLIKNRSILINRIIHLQEGSRDFMTTRNNLWASCKWWRRWCTKSGHNNHPSSGKGLKVSKMQEVATWAQFLRVKGQRRVQNKSSTMVKDSIKKGSRGRKSLIARLGMQNLRKRSSLLRITHFSHKLMTSQRYGDKGMKGLRMLSLSMANMLGKR